LSRTLLIAPHADDETLFASYLAQRYGAHVLVVYDEGRDVELEHATTWLGCVPMQLPVEKGAHPDVVASYLRGYVSGDYDRFIIPDVEEYGHEEHNLVGSLAVELIPIDAEVIRYRTYSPRGTRSHGTPVVPERPEWIARKLAAMSCYRTQIEDVSTRPWFYDLLDMREWTS